MIKSRAKYRVKKIEQRSIWTDIGRPWLFMCRKCGRLAHRESQKDAIAHAELHDCAPGSLW